MTRVSVSELKAHLSRYLREVRRGGEGKRRRLIEAGILRPGKGGLRVILERSPIEVPSSILEALREERSDRL